MKTDKQDDQKVNEVLKKMLNTPPTPNKPLNQKDSPKRN
jgi:hypothetical protein